MTTPAVGASSRAMRFSRVDLPHPDAPSRQTNSPGSIRTETSSSTGVGPPKLLPTSSITTVMTAPVPPSSSGSGLVAAAHHAGGERGPVLGVDHEERPGAVSYTHLTLPTKA